MTAQRPRRTRAPMRQESSSSCTMYIISNLLEIRARVVANNDNESRTNFSINENENETTTPSRTKRQRWHRWRFVRWRVSIMSRRTLFSIVARFWQTGKTTSLHPKVQSGEGAIQSQTWKTNQTKVTRFTFFAWCHKFKLVSKACNTMQNFSFHCGHNLFCCSDSVSFCKNETWNCCAELQFVKQALHHWQWANGAQERLQKQPKKQSWMASQKLTTGFLKAHPKHVMIWLNVTFSHTFAQLTGSSQIVQITFRQM